MTAKNRELAALCVAFGSIALAATLFFALTTAALPILGRMGRPYATMGIAASGLCAFGIIVVGALLAKSIKSKSVPSQDSN